MLGIYDNATIDILSETPDPSGWGKPIESVAYPDLSVRLEPVNKPVKDRNGREVMADTLIMISTPDTSIKWDDKIIIKKIDGETIDTVGKKYVIKSKFKVPEFISSHWEVYL